MFPIPRAKIGSSIGHNTEDLSDRGLDDVTFPDDVNNVDGVSINGGGSTIPSWMSLLERRDIRQNLNAFGMALGRKSLPGNSTIDLSPFSAKTSTTGSVVNPAYEPTPFFTLPHSIESFSIDGDKRSVGRHRTRNSCLLVLLLMGLMLALAAISTGTLYTVVDRAPSISSGLNASDVDIPTSSSSSPTPPATSTTPTTTTTTITTNPTTTTIAATSSSPTLMPSTNAATTTPPPSSSTSTTASTTPSTSMTRAPSTPTPSPTTTTTTTATSPGQRTTVLDTTTPPATTTVVVTTTTEPTPMKSTSTEPPMTTTLDPTTTQPTTATSTTPQPTTTEVVTTTPTTTQPPPPPTTTTTTTTTQTTTVATPTTTLPTTTTTTTAPTTTEETTTTTTTTTTPTTTIAAISPETTTATTLITETTTENTTTAPPPIYIVTNVSEAFLYTPTNITCLWTKNETSGPVVLKGVDVDLGYENTISAFRESGQHGSFYPGLFTTAVSNTSEGLLLMTTTITNTTCLDASLWYQCGLLDDSYQKHQVPMELTVLPDVTITAAETYVIENVIFAVTCRGVMGPSFADVVLTGAPKSDGTFETFTAIISEARTNLSMESCSGVQEVTIDIQMTSSLNGSVFRCETSDPEGYSEEYTLLMIAESLCSGVPIGNFVAHPYDTSQYLICAFDLVIKIESCDPGYIFSSLRAKCFDPFAASVSFNPTNFTDNSTLRLECSISEGNYSSIELLKIEGETESLMAVFHVNGTDQVLTSRSGKVTVMRAMNYNSSSFVLEIENGDCDDVGQYTCRHDNGKYSSGQVDIEIQAQQVEITLPDDIIEGQPFVISCHGLTDAQGDVTLTYSNSATGGQFLEVDTTSQFGRVDSVVSSDACKATRHVQFIGAASPSLDNNVYQCQTSSPFARSSPREVLVVPQMDTPSQFGRADSVFVVPQSACKGQTDQSLEAHPYSMQKYLVCGVSIEVRQCDDSQEWNQELAKCVNTDAAAVTFIGASSQEGQGFELTCAVTEGSFVSIGLYRLGDGGEEPISSFGANGSDVVLVLQERGIRTSRREAGDGGNGATRSLVTAWEEATCGDGGRYECRHDNGQRSEGYVTVFAQAPTTDTSYVELQGWPVSNRPFTVHCHGVTLDKSRSGNVSLERSRVMGGPFEEVKVDDTVVDVISTDDCKSVVTASLSLSQASMEEWNGTFVRCVTTFPQFASDPRQLLVIQDSVCRDTDDGSFAPNVYSPHEYIRCVDNSPVFETCPDVQIWRQDLSTCAEKDAAEVSTPYGDLLAEVNDAINITCSVTNGSYAFISLVASYDDERREEELVRYFPNATQVTYLPQVTSALRNTADGHSTDFITTLGELTCENAGVYTCRHDNTQAASASLKIEVPPSVQLTPDTDYTPITTNFILCDGNVDLRSDGQVKLTQRDPATGQFFDSGVPLASSALTSPSASEGIEGCWKRRQARFQTVFDLSFNDTTYRCETTAPPAVSDPFNVLVIPGDICIAEPIGGYIAHPYTASKYIICLGSVYVVMPCPAEQLYFNTLLNECVPSGFAATDIQTPASFVDNGQITISCLLSPGNFSTLTLYKVNDVNGDDLSPIASLQSDLSTRVFRPSSLYVNMTSGTTHAFSFDVTISNASCQELGGYTCAVNDVQNRSATVDDVIVPPSVQILPEEDFTPITTNSIVCQGILDVRTGGEIRLTRKDVSSGLFVDAGIPVETSTVRDEVEGCWQSQVTTFKQIFDMSWNDTELRCETTAPEAESDVFNLLVVPADICLSESIASRLRHPYTDKKEIVCFVDLFIIMPCPGNYVFNDVSNGCADPEIAVTRLDAPSTFTDLDDLRLTCRLSSGSFSSLTLLKVGQTDTGSSELIALLDSDLNLISSGSEGLSASVNVVGDVKVLDVVVSKASCPDVGVYMCLLDSGDNHTVQVDITVPDSPIALSFGQDFISDTAYNVSCYAPVQGQKEFVLQSSRRTNANFQDTGLTPVYSRPQTGDSKCRLQADFLNIYDMTWNGTDVRCQATDQTQTSNQEKLLVIPGDYCESFPVASPQQHPYTDTKYIYCFGEFLSIFPCPEDWVWNQDILECRNRSDSDVQVVQTKSLIVPIDSSTAPFVAPTSSPPLTTTKTTTATTTAPSPPATATTTSKVEEITPERTTTTASTTEAVVIPVVYVSSVNVTLGSPADIICTITDEGWSTVFLVYLRDDGGTDLVSSFSLDGSSDFALMPGVRVSRTGSNGQNVTLTSTFQDVRCTNDGRYVCSDDGAHSGEGTLGVIFPPQDISMTTPPYMTSYEGSTFVCTGKVTSEGRLFFSVKRDGQEEYQELSPPSMATEVTDVTDCAKTIALTLDFVFDMTYNGSHIRCESSDQSKTSEDIQMLILPSTYCDGTESGQVLEYPYSCQSYVTCLPLREPIVQSCAPGLCYSVELGSCQVKEVDGAADTDPYSCQGKPASSYVPDVTSCTAYNWCVNGQPIPGTCPPLTFFSSTSPPCSNVASEAFCSAEELRLLGFDV